MIIVLIIAIILFFIFSVTFKLVVFNFFQFVKYQFKDIFFFFKYKKFNNLKTGEFLCFDACDSVCFGSGKTLSCVGYLYDLCKKYAGKKVYIDGKWKKQKIIILSNLRLNYDLFPSKDCVMVHKLKNMNEIIHFIENAKNKDDSDYIYKFLTFIDECQNSLHCRNFKNNLNPQLLKSLTECRHYNLSIFYTCPRFVQVDLLLRQSTSLVCHCKKFWRFQYHYYYLATDLDSGKDSEKLKPKKRKGFFVKDLYYNLYDTLEIVEEIEKGEYLSDAEIVSLQGSTEQEKPITLAMPLRGRRAVKK